MRKLKKSIPVLFLLISTVLLYNCSSDDNSINESLTPSEILASTAWETTNAKNETGANVPLTDANVINFVGFAYFNINGTFTMYNLDDSPKMQGDWSVSPDGKTRTIIAKNDAGETLFTRVVDITVLNKNEFTYRIYPNAENTSVYYDIIHTPTNHVEPN